MQKKKLTGYESVYTGYGSVSSGCEFVSGYGFVVWQVSYTDIPRDNILNKELLWIGRDQFLFKSFNNIE